MSQWPGSSDIQMDALLKEVIWLRNGENLLDYTDSSPQLSQQLQTYKSLGYYPSTPHPLRFTASNSAFSNRSSQPRSKPGQFPFSNVELLSLKRSYSEQPNAVVIPAVFDQAVRDAQLMLKMSALQRDGLVVTSKTTFPKYEDPEQPETLRDILHSEMVACANQFMENRREAQAKAKKLAKAFQKHHEDKIKEVARIRLEERALVKKQAKWITKEVMGLWGKIKDLIIYKHNVFLENKKKEKMEKHLGFLVETTAKYTTSVAADLRVESAVNPFEGCSDEPATTLEPPQTTRKEIGAGEEVTMEEAAAFASALQPTGHTLRTTTVKTVVPFLLKGKLREYQHIGLDWLVTMYEKRLNGILADEMGLGKTIMTISLLAHLACEKGIWGPHLIIVPTSVLLNWDMELKKWCPGFKILSYYGTQKERNKKREGWTRPNAFHVCITSYKLAVQDHKAFRKFPWHYLILDEAHHIKNAAAQRWQTLLRFNSQRRLLLTGTPIQNNLMELWSLMHFLMPNVFSSSSEFKDWFDNPVNSMLEGETEFSRDLMTKLHGILRPFILRRLKSDVEQQLPKKFEHIVPCTLSKRQRGLYDEFIGNAQTQATLRGGSFLGVANILMQLRKVCNHPDLFEGRPILSPFDQARIPYQTPSQVIRALEYNPFTEVDLDFANLKLINHSSLSSMQFSERQRLKRQPIQIMEMSDIIHKDEADDTEEHNVTGPILEQIRKNRRQRRKEHLDHLHQHFIYINEARCNTEPIYPQEFIQHIESIQHPSTTVVEQSKDPKQYLNYSNALRSLVRTPEEIHAAELETIRRFSCVIPKARSSTIQMTCSHPDPSQTQQQASLAQELLPEISERSAILHDSQIRSQIYFPDRALVQYDCGKLQELDLLLRKLKKEGHRALIFTQMTKMLDVFEVFLNLHGHTYLRLDGTTGVEKRQQLMEWFNNDPKVFLFILSTRAGGLGINLVGADTVIFYDSDWNPAMDQQAQDRCHRIGQTREVHIYRLISVMTIEENILKKSRQKVTLQKAVIKQGQFTTDFFQSIDLRDLIKDENAKADSEQPKMSAALVESIGREMNMDDWEQNVLAQVEDETDAAATMKALEEQNRGEYYDEFDDDEKESKKKKDGKHRNDNDKKAGKSVKDTKKKSILDKSEWEDRLKPVQKYAMRFLTVIDPVIDEEALVADAEAMMNNQAAWEIQQKQQRVEEDSEIQKEKAAHLSKREAQSAKAHYETIQPTQPEKKRKRAQSNGTAPKRRKKKGDDDSDELWT